MPGGAVKNRSAKSPKVVILVNDRCASSCRIFLLWAMQSKKVTLMGSQTAGIADYGSINTLSVPCHNWLFAYPTARSNRGRWAWD
ncbi:MAG: hypothetical protein IPH31_25040 [Lewinellaceae bacterium]|nr:hypothetical protein [Lewinellaceae bacterium]